MAIFILKTLLLDEQKKIIYLFNNETKSLTKYRFLPSFATHLLKNEANFKIFTKFVSYQKHQGHSLLSAPNHQRFQPNKKTVK